MYFLFLILIEIYRCIFVKHDFIFLRTHRTIHWLNDMFESFLFYGNDRATTWYGDDGKIKKTTHVETQQKKKMERKMKRMLQKRLHIIIEIFIVFMENLQKYLD